MGEGGKQDLGEDGSRKGYIWGKGVMQDLGEDGSRKGYIWGKGGSRI